MNCTHSEGWKEWHKAIRLILLLIWEHKPCQCVSDLDVPSFAVNGGVCRLQISLLQGWSFWEILNEVWLFEATKCDKGSLCASKNPICNYPYVPWPLHILEMCLHGNLSSQWGVIQPSLISISNCPSFFQSHTWVVSWSFLSWTPSQTWAAMRDLFPVRSVPIKAQNSIIMGHELSTTGHVWVSGRGLLDLGAEFRSLVHFCWKINHLCHHSNALNTFSKSPWLPLRCSKSLALPLPPQSHSSQRMPAARKQRLDKPWSSKLLESSERRLTKAKYPSKLLRCDIRNENTHWSPHLPARSLLSSGSTRVSSTWTVCYTWFCVCKAFGSHYSR